MPTDYREDIPYEVIDAITTQAVRGEYWATGAALQATDGLEVSHYASEVAKDYVAGAISAPQLVKTLEDRYSDAAEGREDRQAEADVVAARIAELLESGSFVLRPSTLMGIHERLFQGVLPDAWVGRPRTQNISKREPVLGGRSVAYLDSGMIARALEYDFEAERTRARSGSLDASEVEKVARFVSGVWQIHTFREGNTRTIAAFAELYLRSLGARVSNEPFIQNSVYFRDALVRASFSDLQLGVQEDYSFIERFFRNAALGEKNVLDPSELNLHGLREDGDGTSYR